MQVRYLYLVLGFLVKGADKDSFHFQIVLWVLVLVVWLFFETHYLVELKLTNSVLPFTPKTEG